MTYGSGSYWIGNDCLCFHAGIQNVADMSQPIKAHKHSQVQTFTHIYILYDSIFDLLVFYH